MKTSAKTEYACVAMLALAGGFGSREPLRIRSIAERHGIPSRFLVQILLQLKRAGLVTSTRGAAGGYRLAKPPESITLEEVMAAVDGREAVPAAVGISSPAVDVLHQVWHDIRARQREMLAAVTLADLTERASAENGSMYYI